MTRSIVILAAGKGSRMRGQYPKVLQLLAGRPLLWHVMQAAAALNPQSICVVIPPDQHELIEHTLSQEKNIPHVTYAYQDPPRGTADAVACALPHVGESEGVLILYADVPCVDVPALEQAISAAQAHEVIWFTAQISNPTGYGRIVRNAQGSVQCVVEEKDADEATRAVCEINTGLVFVPTAFLKSALPRIQAHNAQGERYLTDLMAMALEEGLAVRTHRLTDPLCVQGVNTPMQRAVLERAFQQRQAQQLLQQGVCVMDPDRLDVRGTVEVGLDVLLDVNVVLEGHNVLGDRVHVGAGCVLRNTHLKAGTHVAPYSVLEEAVVGPHATVGPFARLRPGTCVGTSAHVGNFVEIKKSVLGAGTKVGHLSYIGDAQIGEDVNVGAGTITCNYDGHQKHTTHIEDSAFVGSGTELVAPVRVGKGATVGAGTTVTQDVPDHALTVRRSPQKIHAHWKRPGASVPPRKDTLDEEG